MQLGAAYHEDESGPDDSLERTIREKEMTEALNVYIKALATLFQTTTTCSTYIFTARFFWDPEMQTKRKDSLRMKWLCGCDFALSKS